MANIFWWKNRMKDDAFPENPESSEFESTEDEFSTFNESEESEELLLPEKSAHSSRRQATPAKQEDAELDESNSDSDEEEEEDAGEEDFSGVIDDPLAPGFDLDGGDPLDEVSAREETRRYPYRSKIGSAAEFFSTEILYRFDILEDEFRTEVAGKYRIELRGYNGGVWTISLGDDITVENRRDEADVVLSMQQSDFLHLVNGKINPQLAMLSQKVKVVGDVRKAVSLQALLFPSQES